MLAQRIDGWVVEHHCGRHSNLQRCAQLTHELRRGKRIQAHVHEWCRHIHIFFVIKQLAH